MTLRIVDEGTYSEPMHHALDEVLLDRLAQEEIDPTLRIWDRKMPAIPFGRFQSYEDEIAVDYVESRDIVPVRRVTGGGAMYVEPGDVITYSLYLPESEVPSDIEESYATLDQWVIDALDDVGLPVEHEPLNDISHAEGKIGGAAQLRSRGAVLHHTTMSYDLNIESMLSALRIGEEKVSDKAVASAEKRVAVMRDHIDASRDDVIEAMISSFQSAYGGDIGSFDTETLDRARDLAESKFSTNEWNRQL
jgi:lipoate-protein ligase A